MNDFENIERLYYVWNADFSVKGAFKAAADFVRGVEDCALCEIAYNGIRQKPEWKQCQESLSVPIEALCRNQLDDRLVEAANGEFPIVLAEVNGRIVKLMGAEQITRCQGDVGRFKEALTERARSAGRRG